MLMAAGVMAYLRLFRKQTAALTRWARQHPRWSQGLIAVIELLLLTIGLHMGYNLYKLDVTMPTASAYVFSVLLAAGFLSVHFLPKRGVFFLPSDVERHRLSYLCIALSSVVLMAFTGNKVPVHYPGSMADSALERVDRIIFPEALRAESALASNVSGAQRPSLASLEVPGRESMNLDLNSSEKELKKAARKVEKEAHKEAKKAAREAKREVRKSYREAYSAGMCALAVFLIILLVATTCGGICLLIYGISEGSIAGIVLGPVVTVLSIWAIAKVAKWCKREQPVNAPKK
jgi:hypothetical protein